MALFEVALDPILKARLKANLGGDWIDRVKDCFGLSMKPFINEIDVWDTYTVSAILRAHLEHTSVVGGADQADDEALNALVANAEMALVIRCGSAHAAETTPYQVVDALSTFNGIMAKFGAGVAGVDVSFDAEWTELRNEARIQLHQGGDYERDLGVEDFR